MSYILDALRKSQQARQPGTAPRVGAVHDISLTRPPGGWWLVLGLTLLLGIVAAGVLFWRGTVARLPDPPPATAASEPAATAPVTEPAAPVAAGMPAPAPEISVARTVAVADLAEQARIPAPAAPPRKIAAVRPANKPAAQPRPATTRTAAATAPALPLIEDDTPLLQQMPAEFQRALPPLAVTIHVYSHDESQRILFINNREYRRGSRIEGGIRVEDIVPDGAVLSFRGERFKLSRPR